MVCAILCPPPRQVEGRQASLRFNNGSNSNCESRGREERRGSRSDLCRAAASYVESEAEYTVGWVRIAVGLARLTPGLFVSSGGGWLGGGQHMNFVTGLATVGAYIALGVTSFVLCRGASFGPGRPFYLSPPMPQSSASASTSPYEPRPRRELDFDCSGDLGRTLRPHGRRLALSPGRPALGYGSYAAHACVCLH